MYVFYQGYLDYERFNRMTDDGYFFLSRLGQNAKSRVIENFDVSTEKYVETDEILLLGGPQNRGENVFRRLKVIDSQGRALYLITNRFNLFAQEISDM